MKQNVYRLEGLTCAHCAGKIEERISQIEGFEDVSLNFTTQTLSFEALTDDHLAMLQEEIDAIEDGVVVKLKTKEHVHHHVDDALHEEIHDHEHHHEHDHSHGDVDKKIWYRLAWGGALFLSGLLLELSQPIELAIFLAAYTIIGGDVVLRAYRNIRRGQVFDENFLMVIATVGAFAIGEYPEGVTVMLFYQIGELFQDMAVNRSRNSIAGLMDIRPDVAWIYDVSGSLKQVAAESVEISTTIIVKPGERVPLDGMVSKGQSLVDTSALTGESVPRSVSPGVPILSGSVNTSGAIEIEVTKSYGESTVAKILDLVENATNKKAQTEKFITKFARYYTPAVVYLALALAILPPLLTSDPFSMWFHRALIFLVVSCPCALVISIPLGFFGGIGGASKKGILIKGSNYLEALRSVDTVVLDKTGTITKGVFKVGRIEPVDMDEKDLLKMVAAVENGSNHPIAKSIIEAYKNRWSEDLASVEDLTEVAGKGLKAKLEGQEILVGNRVLMVEHAIEYLVSTEIGTNIYVALGGVYKGHILIADEIKEHAREAILALKGQGVKRVVMLTGDSEVVAKDIASQVGIDEVYANLLPQDKVSHLENILEGQEKGKTIFVGDGINDAPVLARADIGVAMGGVGSDAAIEAADVVLMTDELTKLSETLAIAKATNAIVWQNIAFALGVKGLVLILGAGGLATMWEAVFADVGVALIAIVNAMRIMRK